LEVKELPLMSLKRAFHAKIAEMNDFVKRGKIQDYTTQTLKLGPSPSTPSIKIEAP
jgi:hypothetical protein